MDHLYHLSGTGNYWGSWFAFSLAVGGLVGILAVLLVQWIMRRWWSDISRRVDLLIAERAMEWARRIVTDRKQGQADDEARQGVPMRAEQALFDITKLKQAVKTQKLAAEASEAELDEYVRVLEIIAASGRKEHKP
jgi:hypothetical protein